jgi:hypothetical protein
VSGMWKDDTNVELVSARNLNSPISENSCLVFADPSSWPSTFFLDGLPFWMDLTLYDDVCTLEFPFYKTHSNNTCVQTRDWTSPLGPSTCNFSCVQMGEFDVDLDVPVTILREKCRRRLRASLNTKNGEGFLFLVSTGGVG